MSGEKATLVTVLVCPLKARASDIIIVFVEIDVGVGGRVTTGEGIDVTVSVGEGIMVSKGIGVSVGVGEGVDVSVGVSEGGTVGEAVGVSVGMLDSGVTTDVLLATADVDSAVSGSVSEDGDTGDDVVAVNGDSATGDEDGDSEGSTISINMATTAIRPSTNRIGGHDLFIKLPSDNG